ncbi:heparan sulfate glucosamine 3-O-sulfotransferase 6 [Paramuricea clavata]|uniref:Heparan sulfate glucosamine 3-O-sulfotransferase 6 n=1 Tax=Paramuricea clavata TaxID=317549 RepID=A0A7D9HB33_PARCT|nr:heparan sulfate glucosamine 3-O-sulfotransferase 6 [Paramuricea clavata]
MNIRRIFGCLCFCGIFGMIIYHNFGPNVFKDFTATGGPSVAVNGVVALTGFLSISQHQLNSKTSHIENLHIIQDNLSSRNPKRVVINSETKVNERLNRTVLNSWEELELYTLPKPSPDKVRRKFRNEDELDQKYLRNDERSIERIVDGLATGSDENLPKIFEKKGTPMKRFPNLIIIGVKKGGTRALLEMIKLHPQVCSSGPEIHYFDRYYNKGIEWYRERMPLCYENELIMEKTPSYFVTSGVTEDIFQYSTERLNRTLKLLVIVRDPTRRAISDFTQTQGNEIGVFKRTFEELALKQSIDGEPYVNSQWGAIKIGVYSKHLKRWQRYFKPHEIHVVSGEHLIKQPYDEIKRVEKFLNLPSFIKREHFVYNKTKGFYCFDKQISQPNTNVNETDLRCLGSSKGRAHVFVSTKTETLLRDYFRPFNEELYQLIGRNFGWP